MKTAFGLFLLALPLLLVAGSVLSLYWIVRRQFLWQLVRIFQEKPLFVIPRGEPDAAAEDLSIPTVGRAVMKGAYFKTPATARTGVIVFGIEYGSDRWSCRPYCEALSLAGYDIFTYEPRGQGTSDPIPGYEPLQWLAECEIADAETALAYVTARPDADPRGVGWFGVSKGANAGLAMAAMGKPVRAVATDGAFGLITTMTPYMRHWVRIYNKNFLVHGLLPTWFYAALARAGLGMVERERKVRFFRPEKIAGQMDRPLLMIHGEADSYIKPEMGRAVFNRARGPKEFWVVPKARHNQALATAGAEYADKVTAFFDQHMR